jgi:hypothetical protein
MQWNSLSLKQSGSGAGFPGLDSETWEGCIAGHSVFQLRHCLLRGSFLGFLLAAYINGGVWPAPHNSNDT